MYFKQIEEILEGQKTQTRRVVKPGEKLVSKARPRYWHPCVVQGRRIKWQVGRDYAVSPGRGKQGLWWRQMDTGNYQALGGEHRDRMLDGWKPLRIRITGIRQERLQDISEADAIAEGLRPVDGFAFLDAPVAPGDIVTARDQYRDLWNSINGKGAWDKNVLVWVLEFVVVR